jgi:Fe-S-cluster containining protein
MKTIKEELPFVYSNLLPDFFNNPLPEEELATCDNCVMLGDATGTNDLIKKGLFSPISKCCTFYPNLPNYLVGEILLSEDKTMVKGQNAIIELINNGSNTLPIGIRKPKKYELLFNSSSKLVYGKSSALICPYYNRENGFCSIWKSRNSICSTWFCKYTKGTDGEIFYDKLKRYLNHIEKTLSNYAANKMGYSASEILNMYSDSKNDKLNSFEIDEIKDIEKHKIIWGKYAGQEIEFYKNCYEIVSNLNQNNLNEIIGFESNLQLDVLIEAYENMENPQIPETLILNPKATIIKTPEGDYKVNNSFEISNILFDAIQFFDGYSKNNLVLKKIEKELNVSLDEELLIYLYQNRLLTDSREYL